MTENKRYIDGGEECVENQFLIDTEIDEYFFINHGLDEIIKRLNEQEEEIQELKQRNKRQYDQLKEITDLMMEREWKSLEKMVEDWEQTEKKLEREWGTYGDVE